MCIRDRCTTVKSVKYIYKYVYKGYDSASVELSSERNEPGQEIQIDEVNNFLNGRYVGSTEEMCIRDSNNSVWSVCQGKKAFILYFVYDW